MEHLKLSAITFIVIMACYVTFCQSFSNKQEMEKKYDECFEKCGGHEKVTEEIKKGESVCVRVPEEASLDPLWPGGPLPPCMTECLGYKASENQTACLCLFCWEVPYAYTLFCTEPGQPRIESSDCDSTVCTGNAKVYGEACKQRPIETDATKE